MLTLEDLRKCHNESRKKHQDLKDGLNSLCHILTASLNGKVISISGRYHGDIENGVIIRVCHDRGNLFVKYRPWYKDHEEPRKSIFKVKADRVKGINETAL